MQGRRYFFRWEHPRIRCVTGIVKLVNLVSHHVKDLLPFCGVLMNQWIKSLTFSAKEKKNTITSNKIFESSWSNAGMLFCREVPDEFLSVNCFSSLLCLSVKRCLSYIPLIVPVSKCFLLACNREVSSSSLFRNNCRVQILSD